MCECCAVFPLLLEVSGGISVREGFAKENVEAEEEEEEK